MKERKVISTGSLRLDFALGSLGIPQGQIVEIRGAEGSGKTTLCLRIIAETQNIGGTCAFIDFDHTFDPSYARRCGIDSSLLLVCEPRFAEQAFDITERLANSRAISIIVWDSLMNIISQDELATPLGALPTQSNDALLSRFLTRLPPILQRTGTTMVVTNHYPSRNQPIYRHLNRHPSRLILNLHTSIRLELFAGEKMMEHGLPIGKRIRVRVAKNKNEPCLSIIKLDIIYNHGIIKAGEIFDLGIQMSLIKKHGAEFFYDDCSLGADRLTAVKFLLSNEMMCHRIEQVIRQKMLALTG